MGVPYVRSQISVTVKGACQMGSLRESMPEEIVAVDGKTLRRSFASAL